MVGRSSLLIAFLSVAAGMLSTDAAAMSLEVEGTEFKLTSDQGMVMRSRELIGAVLTINTGNGSLKLRIDAVERDPEANRGDIWLHSLSTQAADGSWRNLCDAGPDGRRQAFPLALRPRRSDGLMACAAERLRTDMHSRGARQMRALWLSAVGRAN